LGRLQNLMLSRMPLAPPTFPAKPRFSGIAAFFSAPVSQQWLAGFSEMNLPGGTKLRIWRAPRYFEECAKPCLAWIFPLTP